MSHLKLLVPRVWSLPFNGDLANRASCTLQDLAYYLAYLVPRTLFVPACLVPECDSVTPFPKSVVTIDLH